VTLFDFKTKQYLSNTLILSVKWEQLYESKWIIGSEQEKVFVLNSSYDQTSEVAVVFELVLYVPQANDKGPQQISCCYGKAPLLELVKGAKLKIDLQAGNPFVNSEFDATAVSKPKKSMFGSVKKELNNIK